MCRIICFTDTGAVASTVEATLGDHDLYLLSATRLTADVRDLVKRLAPDVVLLELTRALDNAHLFFFLRSDQVTRDTPVILVSPSDFTTHHADILEADSVLGHATLADHLSSTVARLMPKARAVGF